MSHETSPEKARATYAVFCPGCDELSVMSPLYSCDKCEQGVHHDFRCPACETRWVELDTDVKPV